MERENYFILLELEPAELDTEKIKAALHRKKQEWTRWQDNPGKRNAALKNLSMAAEIEKTMLDPVSRTQEALDAQEIRKDMLREFEAELRILEGKGYILPREAAAIALKYKVYGVDKDYVAAHAKCPISDAPAKQTQDNEDTDLIDKLTARTIERNLSLIGFPDLYAFLGEQPYASIKKLQDAAEAKRAEAAASGSKTSDVTITQELCGICVNLFANFDAKQRYDRYLKVSKYPALGTLIDEEFTRQKYISHEMMLRLINFAVEKYNVKVLDAEEYVRRYCAAYGILIDNKKPQITCPHCQTLTAREAAVCTNCAEPLRGECPSCSTPFEGGVSVCPECGFSISDMARAIRYISDAQTALIEGNWSSAQRGLAYARKFWPGHSEIEPLEKRARNLEERYARYVESISDCAKHRQYYAALELVQEAQTRRIRLPISTIDHIQSAVADFEKKLAALTADGKDPSFEQMLELTTVVADSLELGRIMAKYPPEAPGSMRAIVAAKQVRLQWTKSASVGLVEYTLVRKEGAAPLSAHDGEIMYEGPANSFTDKTAKPLHEYHYSVFSRRGGSYSNEGTESSSPVLMIPEIENLRILPTDQGAQLSWAFNPDIREVIIWRKLGGERPLGAGEGIQLETDRLDGFSDAKIKNDVEYWYFVIACYNVDGRRVLSHGVCDSVVPHKILAPIEDLTIVKTGNEDEYVVNWNNTQYADVLLLVSSKKPTYKIGEMMMVQDLLSQYRKLDLDIRRTDSARFRYHLSGGVYIFAAAITGKFATLGQSYYLTNVLDVDAVGHEMINGDLYLNMKWPSGVSEVAVTYRFDRYPAQPGEPGSTVAYISKEQYDYDAAFIFKEPEPNTYYFKIHSVFTAPDGTKTLSKGVELLVNNSPQLEVFYTFKYQKRMFSSSGTVSITINAPRSFVLPKVVFVGKIGRLPLRKTDGMLLFEVEKETRVTKGVTYQYQTNMLPQNLFIRMFLHDDAQYESFRLLPATSAKIT